MTRLIFVAIWLAIPLGAAQADTIYFCRAYAGGTFWTNGSCAAQSATIERIANVPSGMPFDQQVNIGQAQQAAAAAGQIQPSAGPAPAQVLGTKAVCTSLSEQIRNYDAMARQPQSGATQDWITAERKKIREQQFSLCC